MKTTASPTSRPVALFSAIFAAIFLVTSLLHAVPPVIPQIPEMQALHQTLVTLATALQAENTNSAAQVLPDLHSLNTRLSFKLDEQVQRLSNAEYNEIDVLATGDELLEIESDVRAANLIRISGLYNATVWRMNGDTNALDEAITNLTDVVALDESISARLPGWLSQLGSAQLPADLSVELELPSELNSGDVMGLRPRVRKYGGETATNTVVTLTPGVVFGLPPMTVPLGNLRGRAVTSHVFLVTMPADVEIGSFRVSAAANNASQVTDYQPILINTNAP